MNPETKKEWKSLSTIDAPNGLQIAKGIGVWVSPVIDNYVSTTKTTIAINATFKVSKGYANKGKLFRKRKNLFEALFVGKVSR